MARGRRDTRRQWHCAVFERGSRALTGPKVPGSSQYESPQDKPFAQSASQPPSPLLAMRCLAKAQQGAGTSWAQSAQASRQRYGSIASRSSMASSDYYSSWKSRKPLHLPKNLARSVTRPSLGSVCLFLALVTLPLIVALKER